MPLCRPAIAALLLTALAGCPTDPDKEAEFQCELGVPDDNDEYTQLNDGGDLELILGFQGFLFVEAFVQGDDRAPEVTTAAIQVAPLDMDAVQTTHRVDLDPTSHRSSAIPIFLEVSELSAYTDTPAQLAVRLQTPTSFCLVVRDVTLVDDDPCIHTTETNDCIQEED